MPWDVIKDHPECPSSKSWGVVNKDGDLKGCHTTKKDANAQVAALNIHVENSRQMENERGLGRMLQGFQDLIVRVVSDTFGLEKHERAMSVGRLFRQVDEAMYKLDGWIWLHDLYRDDDGSIFAIASDEGKLFSYPIAIDGDDISLGEPTRVQETFEPVQETRTRIIRQADGSVRWLSVSCTSVLNKVGEIDSRALFDSFVEHAEETGEYPFRTFYHQGEAFQTGEADYLARDGNAYISSGVYDLDSPLAPYEIKALEEEPEYWGESIGYRATEQPSEIEVGPGVKIPVFSKGVNREISLLPKDCASAWFTHITTQQEVSRMRQIVKDAVLKLVGGDQEKADEFIALVDDTNRAIDDDDLITRDVDDSDDDTQEPGTEPVGDPEHEVIMDDETLGVITARFNDTISSAIAPILERIGVIEEMVESVARDLKEVSTSTNSALDAVRDRIAPLEVEEDEKQKQYVADLPRKRSTKVTYRPREMQSGKTDMTSAAEATLSNLPAYPKQRQR